MKNSFEIKEKTLPERLIISYCPWGHYEEKILEAVDNGSNVLIWFSINLINKDEEAFVESRKFDFNNVAKIIKKIKTKYPERSIVHLMSIGGWNSPHISLDFSPEDWFKALNDWNTISIAQIEEDFYGFDGFDFDLEGHDDIDKPSNYFSIQQLDMIGKLSQYLKKNGYFVSLAPSQSYLNCFESEFDLKITFDPLWLRKINSSKNPTIDENNLNIISNLSDKNNNSKETIIKGSEDKGSIYNKSLLPDKFHYHGKNTYAYILAKYYSVNIDEVNKKSIDTFDFVSIQLYEGWSDANYKIFFEDTPIEDYFEAFIKGTVNGWKVNFSKIKETELNDLELKIPLNKLVIGLANSWAWENSEHKYLFLSKSQLEVINKKFTLMNILPRGFMFWVIKHEGDIVKNEEGKEEKYFLVKNLKEIFKY